MRYRLALILLGLVLAIGLPLAGCGGGDGDGAGTTDLFDTGGFFDTEPFEPETEPLEEAESPPTAEPFQITVPADAPIGPQSPAEKVAELQEALLLLGYKVGAADGIWGAKTRKAVTNFQKKHNLKADGLVGVKTAKAINRELRKLANG